MTADQLRKSILQQAIQGKLVPQDPNDEPASVLLERIREEKARLIREKKIKREKNPSIIFRGEDNSHYEKFTLTGEVKCIDDEIPFDLPKGWEWTRLGEVSFNRDAERIPLSIDERTLLTKMYDYYGASGVIDKVDRYLFDKPLLLVGEDGANLLNRSTPIAFIAEGKFWVNNHAHVLDFIDSILMKYICVFINSTSLVRYVTGTAQPKMNQEKLNSILVPLSPIAEQQRIVTKIEELMPLVEQYGKAQSELETLNNNIREQLKKSVLQYAIEGKLVPQCEEDGTAEDLLAEIQAEKQRLYAEGKLKKKDLTHSTIFRGEDNKYYEQIGKELIDITEDIPYCLPNGWSFCRLSFLCWLDDGVKSSNEVLPYLDAKYQRGKTPPNYVQEGKLVERQTKVILVDGENSGEVFTIKERGYLGSTFKVLQCIPQVSDIWLQYVLENYRPLLKGSKVGAAIPHLNKKLFHNLIVGLPCKKEQQRIAKKLDYIYQVIEG